ncbi:MAG: AAA family ATPase [Gracilimonas sp.]|uniref:McrB family protein n=1 Tax=Gracilimonas sp. TaxID=1974203 RepID=UPI0037526124|nr:AAA family ATPase [Gracilimonas sp.]
MSEKDLKADHEKRNEVVKKQFDFFVKQVLVNGRNILIDDSNINFDAAEQVMKVITEKYIEGGIEGNDQGFSEKLKEQFTEVDKRTLLLFAHAQWLWFMGAHEISVDKKKRYTEEVLRIGENGYKKKDEIPHLEEAYFEGMANYGMSHKLNKYHEIKFCYLLIELFLKIKEKHNGLTEDAIKLKIEKICLLLSDADNSDKKLEREIGEVIGIKNIDDSKEDVVSEFIKSGSKNDTIYRALAMKNALMYLCNPDKHQPIISNNHKKLIVEAFTPLLDTENDTKDGEKLDSIENKIQRIVQVLYKRDEDFYSFYDSKYKPIWNFGGSDAALSELKGLQYKKAIILYGPPGTSKTYAAQKIAKNLCLKHDLESMDKDFENILKKNSKNDKNEEQIARLQLHKNYTYQDFIGGIVLKDGETKAVEGNLYEDIRKAEKLGDAPYILILDEINRVDLSSMFGEVFSALEDRNTEIRVSIPFGEGDNDSKMLSIPQNLYVIGTMNEIDFSLERLDFALRRRFVWYRYGFDADRLFDIIYEKLSDDLRSNGYIQTEVETFVERAKKLNEKISGMPELGKTYEIGHTFFAEIVDIMDQYYGENGIGSKQNILYRKEGPAAILWDISIKPIIEAFLGNHDPKQLKNQIEELEGIFSPENS